MPAFSSWRVERNHKMHFCVVRDTPEGREALKSASGKDSSFKTAAGARRARDRANREDGVELIEILRMRDLLKRLTDAVEALDGTSVENEKLVDDYRAWLAENT